MHNPKIENIKKQTENVKDTCLDTYSIRLKGTTRDTLLRMIAENNLPATPTAVVKYAIKAWINNPSWTFPVKKLSSSAAQGSKIADEEVI